MPAPEDTPRAIIAEDEEVLREQLRDQLTKLWPELKIIAEAEDGVVALRALEAERPDILFLDIQMPGLSGLEVAHQASGRCHVVFVTAYNQYAIAAFEEGAVDYVMKPFSPARLATTIARLKQRIGGAPAKLEHLLQKLAETLNAGRGHLRWITAWLGNDVRLITIEEVAYFRADNKYTVVVTPDAETLIRKSIKELADELDPNSFWQIHRSTLVNVGAIAGVHRDFKGRLRVRLKDRKETLAVSEPYTHKFKHM
ncbi:MAG: response regulator transcription factor [Betaproteobacteria bacterium]|nr:MAG: response regulator transcription factor [Betaproteobacteria bacterium]